MREEILDIGDLSPMQDHLLITWVHTLVIGSGAAGLNAAVQLVQNGIKDVLILTEGLSMGTSINTGSDKQTYYKLSMCGSENDSPHSMAESYFAGGSMHGDLALVEASLSARAFLNLVNLGVPFPRDRYGQFVGYKTDHDPRQRATSIGPYTSRAMCRQLITEAQKLAIPVRQERNVIQLLVIGQMGSRRVAGVLALDNQGNYEAYLSENVVFAVGGPGGLYKTSVYPEVHTGAIGVALMAGARASNLPESQYGLASTKFRWNVSGTYMQVIPRLISLEADGFGEACEFLRSYFTNSGELSGKVFLKGYQWPFDARKVIGGSSIVDILVYIETVVKGRRVFLDFRQNPQDFKFEELPAEALDYLTRSNALQMTPIERLRTMNPGAIELYREHGIDLDREPLEIAVCAQHNNGGLAGNIWWESTNLKHLFPIGEVNGSHGVSRPGGSALNSGQVGGIRAAEYIAACYSSWTLAQDEAIDCLRDVLQACQDWAKKCEQASQPWQAQISLIKERMSRAGAHIRSITELERESPEAWKQVYEIESCGCGCADPRDLKEAFRTRQLGYAAAVYLDAILYALKTGVGSRGSSIVLDAGGMNIHPNLDETWKIMPEDSSFRSRVLESTLIPGDGVRNEWVNCRPIPEIDSWFETTWASYREGKIYQPD